MPKPPPLTADPDFDKLAVLARAVAMLKTHGDWNETNFLRIYAQATEAAGSFTQGLEFVLNDAEPAWLEGLQ